MSIEALISKMNFLHKKAWNELKNFASESLIPWTIQNFSESQGASKNVERANQKLE
jgi:hypothetical protein